MIDEIEPDEQDSLDFSAELRKRAQRNTVTQEAEMPATEPEAKPAPDWGAGTRPVLRVPEDFNQVLRRAAGRIR